MFVSHRLQRLRPTEGLTLVICLTLVRIVQLRLLEQRLCCRIFIFSALILVDSHPLGNIEFHHIDHVLIKDPVLLMVLSLIQCLLSFILLALAVVVAVSLLDRLQKLTFHSCRWLESQSSAWLPLSQLRLQLPYTTISMLLTSILINTSLAEDPHIGHRCLSVIHRDAGRPLPLS